MSMLEASKDASLENTASDSATNDTSSTIINDLGQKPSEDDNKKLDPDLFCCLLQPANGDANYVGIRRLLLNRKSSYGLFRRHDWRCNGTGYVGYRNYIRRPNNWENLPPRNNLSTPGNSGQWSNMFEVESLSSTKELRSNTLNRSSFSSNASDNDRPRTNRVEQAYSFVGMHCIFDQCKASVTILKFGHMSSETLAYGASDGTLTVCSVSHPPSIIAQLKGHTKDVTDFDFSTNNQYIASTSMDKTVRVWHLAEKVCLRVIYGTSPQFCIRFHPVNNNFLSIGNANREITVMNFSTGRVINKSSFDYEVTSMDHDHTGNLIFCGDAKGWVHTVTMNNHTGALSKGHRLQVSSKSKSPVTTVQYRSHSILAGGPVLLTCTQDGNLSFLSIALEVKGYLTLRCSLKLTPRVHSVHACFCPLLSLEKGEYIVAGSEDSNVYFYDLSRRRQTCVNKLQGHRFPVVDVAWNHGEDLLASSDIYGVVIVWKRAKTRLR